MIMRCNLPQSLLKEEGAPMDAQRIMDLVNSREFGKEYVDLNWTGTYRDYLNLVVESPEVARTSFQRIHDMIVGYGSTTYTEYKKEITHWNFFDDPLENGKD